jgi:hypothetical protein
VNVGCSVRTIDGFRAVVIPCERDRSLVLPFRLLLLPGELGKGGVATFSLSLSSSFSEIDDRYFAGTSTVAPLRGAPSCGCSSDCLAVVVVGCSRAEGTAKRDVVNDCILRDVCTTFWTVVAIIVTALPV